MLQRALPGVHFIPATGEKIYPSRHNAKFKDEEHSFNRAQCDGERYDSCQ